MRSASSAGNSETSRKLSTCRFGSTSTCTGASGLMSLIATNSSDWFTYAPCAAMPQKRQSARCSGKDPLLGDGGRADADELADGRIDEPRRVVVAVAATGPVDEHVV